MRNILRDKFRYRKAVQVVLAVELSYLLIWPFCSRFDVQIGFPKDGIRCIPVSDALPAPTVTFNLKLTGISSCPQALSMAASLTCVPEG